MLVRIDLRHAATVDLGGPLVHPVLAKLYKTPAVFDLPVDELPTSLPGRCDKVEAGRWIPLVGKMYGTGLVDLCERGQEPVLCGKWQTLQQSDCCRHRLQHLGRLLPLVLAKGNRNGHVLAHLWRRIELLLLLLQ